MIPRHPYYVTARDEQRRDLRAEAAAFLKDKADKARKMGNRRLIVVAA